MTFVAVCVDRGIDSVADVVVVVVDAASVGRASVANAAEASAVNAARALGAYADQASVANVGQATDANADRASAVIVGQALVAVAVVVAIDVAPAMVDALPNVFVVANCVGRVPKMIVVFVIEAVAEVTMPVVVDSSGHLNWQCLIQVLRHSKKRLVTVAGDTIRCTNGYGYSLCTFGRGCWGNGGACTLGCCCDCCGGG